MCKVKEAFKLECDEDAAWCWRGGVEYNVHKGYAWHFHDKAKVSWYKLVSARSTIPKHSFIMWVYTQHMLPTKVRLSKFFPEEPLLCLLCNSQEEDEHHLSIAHSHAQKIWTNLYSWYPLPSNAIGDLKSVLQLKGCKIHR